MTFTPFGRTDLVPIYSIIRILDVEQVLYLETCKYMFKLKTDLLPTNIGSYFDVPWSNTTHSYNLRKRGALTTGPIVEPRHLRGKSLYNIADKSFGSISLMILKIRNQFFHLKEKLRKNCWNKKKLDWYMLTFRCSLRFDFTGTWMVTSVAEWNGARCFKCVKRS